MDDPRAASIHILSRSRALPAQPVKARRVPIHAKMTPDAVLRLALSDCLAQMTANAGVLRAGRSVEGLHQLRVALRRLEVVLRAFGKSFRQPWLEELRGRAKILSSRLGPARDLDVFVDTLLAAAAKALGEAADDDVLGPLRLAAEKAREQAWKDAHACVASADFAALLDDVAGLVQSRLPLGPSKPLKKLARKMLTRQAARAQKRGRAARGKSEGDLHRLRIALKKLRYTAEIFAPLHERKSVSRYLGRIRKLQDVLGGLNDIAHARAVIAQLAPGAQKDAALRFAAGLVQGWYAARRPRLVKEALQRWERFQRSRTFWD